MFMKTKLLMTAVSIAVLTGCVTTPYQPAGFTGGYTDTHIRDNVYYVHFGGNAWIDTGTVVQYFHRRSKELCAEKGFADYRVLTEKDSSQYTATGGYGYATTVEKSAYGGQIECVN
jgi:hypothetical protein